MNLLKMFVFILYTFGVLMLHPLIFDDGIKVRIKDETPTTIKVRDSSFKDGWKMARRDVGFYCEHYGAFKIETGSWVMCESPKSITEPLLVRGCDEHKTSVLVTPDALVEYPCHRTIEMK